MTSRDIGKIIICFMLLNSVSIIFGLCGLDEYSCAGFDKCIDSEYLCDGDNDCGDNSDEKEELCSRNMFMDRVTFMPMTADSGDCEENQVACAEASGSRCIHKSWVCDGEWDCLQGSDENHCYQSSSTTHQDTSTIPYHFTSIDRDRHFGFGFGAFTTESSQQRCTSTQFRCLDRCINKSWVCDGEKDCEDGNDESPHICLGRSTTRSTSTVRSYEATPVDTTLVDSSTNKNIHSDSAVSSDEKSPEDCDEQTTFSFWNWIQCALLLVGIICIITIVVFVCKKRRSRSAGLNSRNAEDRHQAVSFLNSNLVPECQLVLVGTPVQVQPTAVQSAHAVDQPPPYDTQPSPNLTQMQISTKIM